METKRQKLFLLYFISRASLFGLGYSRIFSLSSQDTWISAILGMLLGILIVFIISKIKQYDNKILNIFIILLLCYFISEELTSLTNFMTSFFVLNTPAYIIGLAAIIVSLYVVNKGKIAILRTSELLFYISIFITTITLCILISYINVSHFLPILTTNYKLLIKSSIFFSLYTTVPLINIESNDKDLIKMYIISCLTIIILIICILGIFGPELTKILRYPEYIVLKRIKILSFIEKIESLLSVPYIFDNMILIIISTYNIKRLISNRTIFYIIIFTTYILTTIYLNNNYIIALYNYYLTPYILLIGLIIIIIKAIKKKPKASYIQRDT